MTAREAEEYLLSLELFGMRFGLDRMRRLMTALGSPQERFASIHVVGTNGKSSTTRMTAAILTAHGHRTGSYLSPHLISFAERIRIDDRDVAPERFAVAVGAARRAAEKVDHTLPDDDRVTQFEALTAAAYAELAHAEVDVAVIEAGLGGRYDATNVIPSRVQVLTNVALEHTRVLGSTVADIAVEKLDVVQPGKTLVVGPGLHPDAMAVAQGVCEARGARLVQAPQQPSVEVLAAGGEYQRRNFAVAEAAAAAFLGELDAAAVRRAAAATTVPGRFQRIGERPETVLDGAHNPDGMAALARSLRAMAGGRRVIAVVSVLEDKDAAGILGELVPLCDEVVCTAAANPRALAPATLVSLCERLGARAARAVATPAGALREARAAAGPDGLVIATGTTYLVGDLLAPAGAARRSML